MGDSQITHTGYVHELLIALCEIPGVRAWKQQTGKARALDNDDRIIAFGLEGSGDITGIMRCKSGSGLRLEIDAKIGRDKLRQTQQNFKAMITAHGGLYIESRNKYETIDIVKNFMESH